MRLRWMQLYAETGNASLVCRRCGISAPTLAKWVRRYTELWEAGLGDLNRRPHHSPRSKVDKKLEKLILEIRRRRLWERRLQSEFLRYRQTRLSLATVNKVLTRNGTKPL